MIKLPNMATVSMFAKSGVLWVALAVLLSTNSCSYLVGKSAQKAKQAEKELVVAREETKAAVVEAEKRAPMVAKKEGVAVAANERVTQAKKDIYYATQNRQTNTNCDISSAELDAYGVLADEINKAASRSGVQR